MKVEGLVRRLSSRESRINPSKPIVFAQRASGTTRSPDMQEGSASGNTKMKMPTASNMKGAANSANKGDKFGY